MTRAWKPCSTQRCPTRRPPRRRRPRPSSPGPTRDKSDFSSTTLVAFSSASLQCPSILLAARSIASSVGRTASCRPWTIYCRFLHHGPAHAHGGKITGFVTMGTPPLSGTPRLRVRHSSMDSLGTNVSLLAASLSPSHSPSSSTATRDTSIERGEPSNYVTGIPSSLVHSAAMYEAHAPNGSAGTPRAQRGWRR